MRNLWVFAVLASTSTLAVAPDAAADATQVGAFVGPRFFSDDAYLGYLEREPFHPHLRTGPSFTGSTVSNVSALSTITGVMSG